MCETTGVCPVCNGSGRVPIPEHQKKWKNSIAGYNREDDTLDCQNCGGQKMFGKPSGKVRLDRTGVPCTHQYTSKNVGRCLTEYTCLKCGEIHRIDSGD